MEVIEVAHEHGPQRAANACDQPQNAALDATPSEPHVDTLSILYVEDNDHLRETIGMLMEQHDRVIVLCANAEDALAECAQAQFDLVITDVSLPGMPGTELCRRLLMARPAQWIALCSGYDFGHAILHLGPNVRSLGKPFELERLDELIAEVAAARKASRP